MQQSESPTINLLDLTQDQLARHLKELGEPKFRAKQLSHWIHHEGVIDPEQMLNLSKKLRAELQEKYILRFPKQISETVSKDGTIKWLFALDGGGAVETVLIPDRDRLTLCVSSQVGCALNCTFCATGFSGFNRNMKLNEIIGQLWLARARLKELDIEQKRITNIVFMGMGEPLLNYEPVLEAIRLMLSDDAYGLSKYRVTLSTSGVVPKMLKLKADTDCALAVSLHAPNDELREQLVPLNKKYPLKELIAVCKDYYSNQPKRQVTIEYVMLDGVNDKLEHAKQLAKLLRAVPCKINLIPFNKSEGLPYTCSSWQQIERFQQSLIAAGYNTRVRRTRGDNDSAACGQLAGEFADRTTRNARLVKQAKQRADREGLN